MKQVSVFFGNGAINTQKVDSYKDARILANKEAKKDNVTTIFFEEYDKHGLYNSETLYQKN